MITTSLFNKFKDSLLNVDPVTWAEKYLTLDGKPFRLNSNGYKPFTDIYRYIGVKALESNSKPVVLVKGRQVGATTMAVVLELYFMSCGLFGRSNKPPMRVMHCFPQLDMVFAYTKSKLNTMITTSLASDEPAPVGKRAKSYIESKLDNNSGSNDSLQYKQFVGGNHIWVESTGISGDRIRGRTVDCMFFDEVQDMRGIAISNSTKILSKAQYGKRNDGIQVFFGTPKQRGSDYWNIWQKSSQQYFHLGCENCKELFPLYTPGTNEWEDIWYDDDLPDIHPSHGFMVRCIHCKHEQDKRDAANRGKWVALNKDENTTFIGFHINQLYMPDFPRWKIIGEKPENHHMNTERAYQNEVLGEFFAGDASPITPEQIDELCADHNRGLTARITPSDGKKVYLGCDWGLKIDAEFGKGDSAKKQQGQSYSCAVILVPDGPHILNIEFALRLKKNNLEYKKQVVEQMFRQYSVTLAVGDIGYANDLTEILHNTYGDKFLAGHSLNRVNGHARYLDDNYPKTIQFEKDHYIAELYDLMKRGIIRFPYKRESWDTHMAWLVEHCCSMEVKPTMDRSGGVGIKYVKGSTPNDGFMALLNAYIAYKYDITEGFSIKNPNDFNTGLNKKKSLLAITGYVPGL